MKSVLIPSLFIIYPRTQQTISKVFPVLFHLSFWKKEKSVANFANRNICDKTQKPSSQFSHCITLFFQILSNQFLDEFVNVPTDPFYERLHQLLVINRDPQSFKHCQYLDVLSSKLPSN